ncbi:mucin-12 [Nematostella vectensis]|uniref:mucin-12 n=1 Tax=Nematostella vectensis TaxID=45351 RepID=UPI00207766CB|nr:mucin-12 [Nematostella vectensis]
MLQGRAAGIMPNPLDTREIFFTNLLLLGFDPDAMEAKESIPFNRDMFVLPNKKGMEVVMRFLFAQLNAQMAYEEFRDCWPVKNKTQEQQFRKTCYNWLTRLSKEEPDSNLPRVVQSLFHSPGGDRFYTFLLLFSLYVLKKVILRDHSKNVVLPPFPTKNIHNQPFSQVISKAVETQTAVHRQRCLDHVQIALEVHHSWKTYALELTKENRHLKKKFRECEKKLSTAPASSQIAKSLAKTSYQQEVDAIKRTQKIQKVRGLWHSTESFYISHHPHREVISSILTGDANKYHLDSTQTQVRVPDLLLRECERELSTKKIENTYVSGKLNLKSLVQLCNLSLHLLKNKIRQDSVPSFEESSAKIKNEVHSHQTLLTKAEQLRSMLGTETISDLKDSVESLKAHLFEAEPGSHLAANYSFNVGLGLAPPTPPVSFRAADTPDKLSSFHQSLRRSPEAAGSTPEVVQTWTESLRGRQRLKEQRKQDISNHNQPAPDLNRRQAKRSNLPKPIPRTSSAKPKAPQNKKAGVVPKTVTRPAAKAATSSVQRPRTPVNEDPVVTPAARALSGKYKAKTEPRKKVTVQTPKQRMGERAWVAQAVADQIIGVMSVDRPESGGSSRNSSRASTPQAHAIEDPLAALDDTAFVSHDLIPRTPAPKEKYGETSLTHDQSSFLEHSDPTKDDEDMLSAFHEKHSVSNNRSAPREGGLLRTLLDQARSQRETEPTRDALTPIQVKSALFQESPSEEVTRPLTSWTGAHRPASSWTDAHRPATSWTDTQRPATSWTDAQRPAVTWNDSPLSQLSFASPDDKGYENHRALSPFSFQTPGKFRDSSPPGEASTSDGTTPRQDSPFTLYQSARSQGVSSLQQGSPFTSYRSTVSRGVSPLVSFTPLKSQTSDLRSEEPGSTPLGSNVNGLLSFTPHGQQEGSPHDPGTPTPPGPMPSRNTGATRLNASPLLAWSTLNTRQYEGVPRTDPSCTPHVASSSEAQDSLVSSMDTLRHSEMLNDNVTSSNISKTTTGASPSTRASQSPLISLSEPTIPIDDSLSDEVTDPELQASKRSPFGNLHIDAHEIKETYLNGRESGVEPACAGLNGVTEDTLPPKGSCNEDRQPAGGVTQSSLRSGVTQSPLPSEVTQSPLRSGYVSDLMDRLNRIKQAQRNTSFYATPRSQELDSSVPEARGLGVSPGASWNAIDSLRAQKVRQMEHAQTRQQVSPGSNTHLNSRREQDPNIATPASLRGDTETPARDHMTSQSGQSTPSSILSERFLLQSPFKDAEPETSGSPYQRVFTLDSPTVSTPDNPTPYLQDFANSPWSNAGLNYPGRVMTSERASTSARKALLSDDPYSWMFPASSPLMGTSGSPVTNDGTSRGQGGNTPTLHSTDPRGGLPPASPAIDTLIDFD